MASKEVMLKVLFDFRSGKLSEEDVLSLLNNTASDPRKVNVKELTPKELLILILNVSSVLLGNRLPTETSQYMGIPTVELLKLLNKAGGAVPGVNRNGMLDTFLNDLTKALQEGTTEGLEELVTESQILTPEIEIVNAEIESKFTDDLF
jgi:hypothetical protein